MGDESDILLVYDKQCPACDYYCSLARIRESVGNLVLIDARDDSPIMREITAAGLDIDEGMVLKIGSQLYFGADAINRLALMSTRKGFFNRLSYWCFRSPVASRIFYPLLKGCRNLLLKVLGRTRINNLDIAGKDRF
ncbi:MAG: DCC1-like thiol-disulfide oxidoreductase family protein [Gammaproteobacteria bacterium]